MPIVLLTGASGMVGKALKLQLTNQGLTVRSLIRNQEKADGIHTFYWNYAKEEMDLNALKDVDYIIHLSGATVSKRWTFEYKKEIYDSRIMSTDFLFKTIQKEKLRLKKFICVSGSGFYGDTQEQNITETSPSGKDFLAMVCRDWENAAQQFNSIKIPVCILRLGVVMSPNEGFIKTVSAPIKWFVGADLGTGQQMIPWIGLLDLCRLFLHVIDKNLVGIYNAASSHPMTLEAIDKAIAKHYHRPLWLPNIPAWLLKKVLGEMSLIVLGSCATSNAKIKNTGFEFLAESFEKTLE